MGVKKYHFRLSAEIVLGAIGALPFLWPTCVFSQAPFFQGKTITVIQGRDPGGTGDRRVKAVISFVQKYIPGNPNIKEYKKLTGDEATPLMPDEMDKAIKGLPRDREIVELFKKISGAGPLPAR